MMALTMAVGCGLGLAGSAPAGETYKVDPVHSSVAFRVRHLDIAPFYGRFNEISGAFTLDEQDPAKSSFEVTIPVEKIDTANAQRDQHLKSPSFFNAKQFATITFKSKKVTKEKDGYKVEGDLTLHGKTKPVTVTIADVSKPIPNLGPGGGYRTGLEARLEIKRSDFGMDQMLSMLGDDVQIVAGIEGTRP